MTQDDLTNTLTAIASLAADAARIAGALGELMKAEQTAWRHGALHRLRGACLELSLHTTQARAALSSYNFGRLPG
jgi:hypothetical protein